MVQWRSIPFYRTLNPNGDDVGETRSVAVDGDLEGKTPKKDVDTGMYSLLDASNWHWSNWRLWAGVVAALLFGMVIGIIARIPWGSSRAPRETSKIFLLGIHGSTLCPAGSASSSRDQCRAYAAVHATGSQCPVQGAYDDSCESETAADRADWCVMRPLNCWRDHRGCVFWNGGHSYMSFAKATPVCLVVDVPWKIISKKPAVVYSSNNLLVANVVGTKPACSRIVGRKEGEWVKLVNGSGYIALSADDSSVQLQAVRAKHKQLKSGTCKDAGMFSITDVASCEHAADALSLQATHVRTVPLMADASPEGCFFSNEGQRSLWMSSNPRDVGRGAVGSYSPICSSQEPCHVPSTCLLQTTYGDAFVALSDNVTLPIKRRYAEKHGYRLIVLHETSFEALFSKYFYNCVESSQGEDKSYDKQTVVKLCSVRLAFEQGCSTVMWTDSDAVIFSSDIKVEDWIATNPNADAFWSVDNTGDPSCEHSSGSGCHSVEQFSRCLNAGTFIIRLTAWSLGFLSRVLERSSRANDPVCSTQKYTGKWGFDQCFLNDAIGRGVGDQCAITCETMAIDEDDTHDSDLDHYMCFGPQSSSHFQHIQMAFSTKEPPKDFHQSTFVVNCFGGKKHGKDHATPMKALWNCVDYFARRRT